MPVRQAGRAQYLDYVIRTCTSAVLSLAIVGAVIYESISGRSVSSDLLGWGGIVIGAYIAQHASLEGRAEGAAGADRAALADAATQAITQSAPPESQ